MERNLFTRCQNSPLKPALGRLLLENKLTIACAESCTGGLVMHRLTNIAGSSAYFLGGTVAYSNQIKHSVLGIQENTLNVFGAVSEQVAAAMARGARAVYGADIAIGVTGVAGPGGGTPEKPVGLTYIGLNTPKMSLVQRFEWQDDRIANKESSAEAILKMVLVYLENQHS